MYINPILYLQNFIQGIMEHVSLLDSPGVYFFIGYFNSFPAFYPQNNSEIYFWI